MSPVQSVLAPVRFPGWAFLLWLIRTERREEAKAVARLIPDCAVLFRRLLADERTPRSTKLLLLALVGYLLMPLDLVPVFEEWAPEVLPQFERSERFSRA